MFFNYRVKFPYPRWPHSLCLIQSPSPPDPASPMSLQPVRFPSSRLPCRALAQPAVQPPQATARGAQAGHRPAPSFSPRSGILSPPPSDLPRPTSGILQQPPTAIGTKPPCLPDPLAHPPRSAAGLPGRRCSARNRLLWFPEPFTSRILIARVITVNACFPG